MNQFLEKVADDTVEVLVKLHEEAKQNRGNIEEYVKRGRTVSMILNKLEQDFSTKFMLYVFCKAQNRLGEALSPISDQLLNRLLDHGFTMNNLKVVVSVKK